MNETVSIIIPVYKAEKYLEECINSVLSQSYKDIQVILVDDGSPDDCPAICDSYALKDERVKVVHKENGGISDARNAGVAQVTGGFVMFVDSDDIIAFDIAERLMNVQKSTGVKAVVCGYEEVPEDTVYDNKGRALEDKPLILGRRPVQERFYEFGKMTECMVPWNKLLKAEIFKADGGIYYPKGHVFEDGATTYKLLYHAGDAAFIPDKLYLYRLHGKGIMGSNADRNYKDAAYAEDGKLAFYEEKKERELYLKELNFTIHSAIHFYEEATTTEAKKGIRRWFKRIYRERFIKEKWSFARKLRMAAFDTGYIPYRAVSAFEGIYNKLKR